MTKSRHSPTAKAFWESSLWVCGFPYQLLFVADSENQNKANKTTRQPNTDKFLNSNSPACLNSTFVSVFPVKSLPLFLWKSLMQQNRFLLRSWCFLCPWFYSWREWIAFWIIRAVSPKYLSFSLNAVSNLIFFPNHMNHPLNSLFPGIWIGKILV